MNVATSFLPETLRTCTATFFVCEILTVPGSWPIVAIGGEVLRLAAVLFPSRVILGIPQPGRNHLQAFLNKADPEIFVMARQRLDLVAPSALWISEFVRDSER
jgi:hypothetical protein